jgi:hypothetical protein
MFWKISLKPYFKVWSILLNFTVTVSKDQISLLNILLLATDIYIDNVKTFTEQFENVNGIKWTSRSPSFSPTRCYALLMSVDCLPVYVFVPIQNVAIHNKSYINAKLCLISFFKVNIGDKSISSFFKFYFCNKKFKILNKKLVLWNQVANPYVHVYTFIPVYFYLTDKYINK